MKKIALMLLPLAISVLAGCGGDPGVDPTKKQIYVGLYNGGWGEDWFDEAASRFEAKFKEYQIIKVAKKDEYQYSTLVNNINTPSDINDMYITECPYYAFLEKDALYDITDAVTKDMEDYGEPGQSVASKMADTHLSYYKTNDKFYAVPFGSAVWALNYDYDLFEEKELFISGRDQYGRLTWTSGLPGSAPKSVGRDGIAGTYDDGTPVTIDEFRDLLKVMREEGIIPFLWSNQSGYVMNNLFSMIASEEGQNNFDIIRKLEGSFTGWDGNTHTITPNNGYDLGYMKGKLHALQFAQEILSNSANYMTGSGSTLMTYSAAQEEYILSKHNNKRVAFLIEGGHWHNEAKSIIEDANKKYYAQDYPNGRRFSVMPFPTYSENPNDRAGYLESSYQFCCFVNKISRQPEGAKEFIRFLCTDEILRLTTTMNGLHRSYKYSLSDEESNKLPFYYRTIHEIQSSEKVDLCSQRMINKFWTANNDMSSLVYMYEGGFTDNSGKYCGLGSPFNDFQSYLNRGLTAQKYVEGTLEARKPTFTSWIG